MNAVSAVIDLEEPKNCCCRGAASWAATAQPRDLGRDIRRVGRLVALAAEGIGARYGASVSISIRSAERAGVLQLSAFLNDDAENEM
jgi:hypothetical protein